MKSKKFIPFLLGCLLMLETPFVSQAAQFSSVSTPAAEESAQVETTLNLTLNHSTGSLYVGGALQLTPSISGIMPMPQRIRRKSHGHPVVPILFPYLRRDWSKRIKRAMP